MREEKKKLVIIIQIQKKKKQKKTYVPRLIDAITCMFNFLQLWSTNAKKVTLTFSLQNGAIE